jgi:hypothetical protein
MVKAKLAILTMKKNEIMPGTLKNDYKKPPTKPKGDLLAVVPMDFLHLSGCLF